MHSLSHTMYMYMYMYMCSISVTLLLEELQLHCILVSHVIIHSFLLTTGLEWSTGPGRWGLG